MRKHPLLLLAILLFTACQKQITKQNVSEEIGSVAAKGPKNKIDVCHNGHKININLDAWPAHQSHGDLRLDDQDGDGYVPNNGCGFGQMGDCDDNNASVYPGATEICGNSIDDNCNSNIDEGCSIIPSVTICDQTWMIKNLDVITYRNGDPIPQVTDPTAWAALTTGAWCYYNNDPSTGAIYGKLYNWYAVTDPRGLAPVAWHVPSDAEWTTLSNCLGGPSVAGGKLKEEGTVHWVSPNTDATNSEGFTALPGGLRNYDGLFYSIGEWGYWWSSTESEFPAGYEWYRYLTNFNGFFPRDSYDLPNDGMSVRCVRD